MKTNIHFAGLVISISVCMLAGCAKESQTNNASEDSINTAIQTSTFDKLITNWGTSISEIESDMKAYKILPHSDESLLAYEVVTGLMKIAFKFSNNALSSVCITAASAEADFTPYLKGYEYVGDIDDASIYQNAGINSMAAQWVIDDSEGVSCNIGFTPIESDYFEDVEVPQDTEGKFISSGAADLGFSVKWAACNLGASGPEEIGNYYAWAETAPKTNYSWRTYKWCDGTMDNITKYITYNTNSVELKPEDDAANTNLGGGWRMPTMIEMNALVRYCTWMPTSYKGVNGYLVTSKKNGNSIFVPSAGYYKDSELVDGCYYWAASTYGYKWSYCVYKPDEETNVKQSSLWRCYGCPIRPVIE